MYSIRQYRPKACLWLLWNDLEDLYGLDLSLESHAVLNHLQCVVLQLIWQNSAHCKLNYVEGIPAQNMYLMTTLLFYRDKSWQWAWEWGSVCACEYIHTRVYNNKCVTPYDFCCLHLAVIASFPGPTKAGEFGSMTWAISGKYI